MPESIIWVKTSRDDSHTAQRTARPPEPLVPVDQILRQRLTSELESALAAVASYPSETIEAGLPLVTRLRPEAQPKSKRPYDFLAAQGLPVAAAGASGELVSKAKPEELGRLMQAIRSRTAQSDVFAISTVDSFRLWNPVVDAVSNDELLNTPPAHVRSASPVTEYELAYFPWIDPANTRIKGGLTSIELLQRKGVESVRLTSERSGRQLVYVQAAEGVELTELLEEQVGVRAASMAPAAAVLDDDFVGIQGIRQVSYPLLPTIPSPSDDCTAIVGVVDSGVSTNVLADWIVDSENFVPAGREDMLHGTFVGGLISAGCLLNGGLSEIPGDQARLVDVQIFGQGQTPVSHIEQALDTALQRWSGTVKVWNCSFAEVTPSTQLKYSSFAQIMDELAKEYGVLFVQAAGNAAAGRRRWPVQANHGVKDVIAPPAEAINSLTVGALSHLDGGFTAKGDPASYSRRGPGFGGLMKPEVAHYAGDFSAGDESMGVLPSLDGWGILSALPGGMLGEGVGTSFSTPLVSVIAANLWDDLRAVVDDVDAALVKGMVAHAAAVNSGPVSRDEAPYRGVGVPPEASSVLSEDSKSFTTVHAADLVDGLDWIKLPFPVPPSMLANGKFRGEVFVTVSFAPLIRPEFDQECVRTSVQATFGPYSEEDGSIKVSSLLESTSFRANEEQLIDDGKWAPLRTYHTKIPRGRTVEGGSLGLRLRLLMRDKADIGFVQRAYAIVTLRSDSDIHAEGIQELQNLNFQFVPLLQETRVAI